MKLSTIHDQWKSYEKEVIPKEASQAQRTECKRAFYAGATGIFMIFVNGVAAKKEQEAVDAIESLNKQLADYAELVKQGHE